MRGLRQLRKQIRNEAMQQAAEQTATKKQKRRSSRRKRQKNHTQFSNRTLLCLNGLFLGSDTEVEMSTSIDVD